MNLMTLHQFCALLGCSLTKTSYSYCPATVNEEYPAVMWNQTVVELALCGDDFGATWRCWSFQKAAPLNTCLWNQVLLCRSAVAKKDQTSHLLSSAFVFLWLGPHPNHPNLQTIRFPSLNMKCCYISNWATSPSPGLGSLYQGAWQSHS